jgi:hypothetical protein
MKIFDAAPPVPLDYPWLNLLTDLEIEKARSLAYVADTVDLSIPVRRDGVDNIDPGPIEDMADWRTRMYVIWFCYIYENFEIIQRPRYAIEELIFEFRALAILDLPNRCLGTLFAGAGASDFEPDAQSEFASTKQFLRPHYEAALALLQNFANRELT